MVRREVPRRQLRGRPAQRQAGYGRGRKRRLGPETTVSGIRSGLRFLPDELDQAIRLARFRAAHPDVIVGDGGVGTVQARIPKPDGEIVITRYTLRELLDKLGELTAGDGEEKGG